MLHISYEANINEKDNDGGIPHYRTTTNKSIIAAKLLISHGANINEKIILEKLLSPMHLTTIIQNN